MAKQRLMCGGPLIHLLRRFLLRWLLLRRNADKQNLSG
jgi:hypothetical protein